MRLSERCFAVTGLAYLPPWSVNAGFIVGDEITLIVDTGANASAAGAVHGYASSLRPKNRLIVVNTEKHFDHIGGNSFFRDRGIDVYGHVGIERTQQEFDAEMAEYNHQISDPFRREQHEEKIFYSGTALANPNRPISQDTVLSLGGCDGEIILTPGHTPTNISVYVPSENVLFSGDCLVNGYLPNLDSGTSRDWRVWLKSLDRVAALAPSIIVPGHGPVTQHDPACKLIEDVRQILELSIRTGCAPTARGRTLPA